MRARTTRNRIKSHEGLVEEHPDPNLNPAYWWNQDKAQTHYFTSVLKDHYPLLKEGWPARTLTCPAGRILLLPHRVYKVHTRDNTLIRGAWIKEEAIHEYPPNMLTRGGALGEIEN